jgi:excisionase family DNA binding protein
MATNVPMSPAQVAEYLQLDVRTVYGYLRSGRLVGKRLGDRCWRVMSSDLYQFLQGRK